MSGAGARRPWLAATVDGAERMRCEAPAEFGARDWMMGVIAVQATVEDGVVVARLRGHVTGAAQPLVLQLHARTLVEVAFLGDGAGGARGAIPVPPLAGMAARVALHVDGAARAEACLPAGAIAEAPPRRAFGHVFCRWLRDGGWEAGCDLTDFLSLPEGVKYTRLVSEPIAPGQVVAYAIALEGGAR